MAMVNFKKGLFANLPAAKTEGTVYVTTDERALYLDVDNSTRIRLGDFQEFATLTALQANPNPSTTALYYITDVNCLAKWNGTAYTQINLDTGATSVEVVGNGNAVTTASYDAATRKLTLTMGDTFVKASEVGDMAGKDKVTETDLEDALKAKVNAAAEGNHSHDNKAVLDGITAEKVAAWDTVGDKAAKTDVDAVGGKIDTLIGTDTGKSARTIANEELTKQLVPENAQEALDTLAEIAAWIQTHPGDASAMSKAINDLGALVGTLPEGATSTTVVAYIKEYADAAIAALKIGDYAKAAELTALADRVTTVEGKSHEHANKTELDKIADGDKAKWDTAATKAGTAVQTVAAGATNGTVSVDGTDVAVKGLDTAAYAKATDFDAAGAATTAEANAKSYADGLMTWGSF